MKRILQHFLVVLIFALAIDIGWLAIASHILASPSAAYSRRFFATGTDFTTTDDAVKNFCEVQQNLKNGSSSSSASSSDTKRSDCESRFPVLLKEIFKNNGTLGIQISNSPDLEKLWLGGLALDKMYDVSKSLPKDKMISKDDLKKLVDNDSFLKQDTNKDLKKFIDGHQQMTYDLFLEDFGKGGSDGSNSTSNSMGFPDFASEKDVINNFCEKVQGLQKKDLTNCKGLAKVLAAGFKDPKKLFKMGSTLDKKTIDGDNLRNQWLSGQQTLSDMGNSLTGQTLTLAENWAPNLQSLTSDNNVKTFIGNEAKANGVIDDLVNLKVSTKDLSGSTNSSS